MKIKWYTSDNHDGSWSIKQHAFKEVRKKVKYSYPQEYYNSNQALCSKMYISEDGESGVPLSDIKEEELNPSTACKTCQRLLTRINPTT